MDLGWWSHVEHQAKVSKTPADFYGGRLAHLAGRLYREFREPDEFSALVLEGLTLEIIAEVSRCSVNESERTPPRWLQQVRSILHEQYGERLSLVAVAELVDVHPVHLAREFRRFYRCTIGDYIRQRRIEFTCNQLRDSDASISEIAQAAGFFDHSHFTRTFKTQAGITPSQYRKALRPR
jgi:AraC-like DNA-binding protein